MVVSKDGYVTTTSRAVTIPPEVTDLHVGLRSTTVPQPVDSDGDGVPDGSDGCPNTAAATANGCPAAPVAGTSGTTGTQGGTTTAKPVPCAGLRGTRLATCKRKQKLDAAIAKCKKGKAGKRALCIKRAKALSKCSAITGPKKAKKTARCVAKAKRIGRS